MVCIPISAPQKFPQPMGFRLQSSQRRAKNLQRGYFGFGTGIRLRQENVSFDQLADQVDKLAQRVRAGWFVVRLFKFGLDIGWRFVGLLNSLPAFFTLHSLSSYFEP